ncbi:MAG: hypothetical protein ABIJ09_08175 [Pseudomonadota bacterium]
MSADGEPQFDPELREHYEQDLEISEERWRFERRVQRLLIAFGVALLSIIFLAIWASTLRSRIAVEVYGDGLAGDGWPSSLRLVARDPKSGAILRPLGVEVSLQVTGDDPQQIENLGLTAETASALFVVDAERLARGASVALSLRTAEEPDALELALRSPAAATACGVHLVDSVQALQKPEAVEGAVDALPALPVVEFAGRTITLRFYPESGTLVPVLMNRVTVLALADGVPASGVAVRVDPLGWNLRTDAQGLGDLQWTPGRELGALTLTPLSGDDEQLATPTPVKVALAAPPSQLLAKPRRAHVAPGGDIVVDIQSVRLRTFLSYEVWYGARLVAQSDLAVDSGHAVLELPAPDRPRVLVGTRVQRAPLGEDVVSDQAFVYVDDGDARSALAHLLEDLAPQLGRDPGLQALATMPVNDDDDAERRMRLLFSRLELDARPQLVASSGPRNQARAELRRLRWQRWLFAGYWTLGLGALALASFAVVLHNRRLFTRLKQAGDDDPAEAEATARSIRHRGTLELIAVVIGMVFGLFIVYRLLSNLWWG